MSGGNHRLLPARLENTRQTADLRSRRSAFRISGHLPHLVRILLLSSSLLIAWLALPVSGLEIQGKLSRRSINTDDGRTFPVWQDERGKDFCSTMQGVRVNIRVEMFTDAGKEYVKVLDYVADRDRASHELWRRMRCNACVVQCAEVNVKPHGETGGAIPISGRYYPFKERIQTFDRQGDTLWMGLDDRVVQVDMVRKEVAATYGRAAGLPDHWIYRVFCDARHAWVAHRQGIAVLDIETEKVENLPGMAACYASFCAEGDYTWVVADSGTWRLRSPEAIPEAMPALPTGERIRRIIQGGVWLPHWRRKTAHFMPHLVAVHGSLYVESYGTIYALEDGSWRMISDNGWELSRAGDRLWFFSPGRLVEYDPVQRETTEHPYPQELARGRAVHVLADSSAIWVALVPLETEEPKSEMPGGLLRFDLAQKTWRVWRELGGSPADHISHITRSGDTVWAAGMEGAYSTRAAHPGMTYVKRRPFRSSRIMLHSLADGEEDWKSLRLSSATVEKRFICGQDGVGAPDDIIPESVHDLLVGQERIFAYQHLYPKQFFSGYWPCVSQVAARTEGGAWEVKPVYDPSQLNLRGEQPLVLNISNKGEMVLEAVGHDEVLALFDHNDDAWVVTEGTVAFFDKDAGSWHKLMQNSYRWYWRASAACDDGNTLFIGSDRGLLASLEHTTGRFSMAAVFKDRAVDALGIDSSGRAVAWARQAVLGQMPADLPTIENVIDADAAAWDGSRWRALTAAKTPPKPTGRKWFVKDLRSGRGSRNVGGGLDRSAGNVLFGPPVAGEGDQSIARFYLKDVFWPAYLCESADASSLWIGTFTGLIRIDLPSDGEE